MDKTSKFKIVGIVSAIAYLLVILACPISVTDTTKTISSGRYEYSTTSDYGFEWIYSKNVLGIFTILFALAFTIFGIIDYCKAADDYYPDNKYLVISIILGVVTTALYMAAGFTSWDISSGASSSSAYTSLTSASGFVYFADVIFADVIAMHFIIRKVARDSRAVHKKSVYSPKSYVSINKSYSTNHQLTTNTRMVPIIEYSCPECHHILQSKNAKICIKCFAEFEQPFERVTGYKVEPFVSKKEETFRETKQADSSVDNTKINLNSQIFDDIKSLKELLDSGVITQEEFDNKKSELLSKI